MGWKGGNNWIIHTGQSKQPFIPFMFFLKETAIFGNISMCSVGRNRTLREWGVKRGGGCLGPSAWQRQPALGAGPQLGVNNGSVQVQLYCFWPKAFCRNNFVTCCQGSFCPQLRQKNKSGHF